MGVYSIEGCDGEAFYKARADRLENERAQLERQVAQMREALTMLYEETKDYIIINHLGDPHHNRSMQLARAALSPPTEGVEDE